MKEAYLVTFVAAIVTTSLASNLLRVATLGPLSPAMSARMKAAWDEAVRGARRLVDDRVAAMLADRERQVDPLGRTSPSAVSGRAPRSPAAPAERVSS
jgi:hypothetical protein